MEDVDFDFFDTPRVNDSSERKFDKGSLSDKPPFKPKRNETERKDGKKSEKNSVSQDKISKGKNMRGSLSSDDERDYSHSENESGTPKRERAPAKKDRQIDNDRVRDKHDECVSESSSAYSNSDYSSDESYDNKKSKTEVKKKEKIEIKMPKIQEAWGKDDKRYEQESKGLLYDKNRPSHKHDQRSKDDRNGKKSALRISSDLSETDSDHSIDDSPPVRQDKSNKSSERVKSAKHGRRYGRDSKCERLTRSNSSHSNTSDITDVSPLESDEESPRHNKRRSDTNVPYDNSPEHNIADIKLETDKIDLSILMKCMADIDREKQERLKNNSRRVMFAPPVHSEKAKSNYTFDVARAKSIEQENQRLLKQIMGHINPSSSKTKSVAPARGPKKAVEPVIYRLTPSAVNRIREQRRIENENMKILQRLNTTKPTSGMSRQEQLKEFEKNATYGIPSGTLLIPGDTKHYEATRRTAHSSMSFHTPGSTQRSRPSSAKSNTSQTPGRRSRPSSAKSNASIRSTASVRSNMSMTSTASKRSSSLGFGGTKSNRPEWNDRPTALPLVSRFMLKTNDYNPILLLRLLGPPPDEAQK